MSFNFKKVFIHIFLSVVIIASSLFWVFASGKYSQEKKPFKATCKIGSLSIFAMIYTGETIKSGQFKGYNFPRSKIILPKAVQIKLGAFSECSALTDVYMPAVKEIGWCAFMKCLKLKNVILPNVKEISCCAFSNCQKLETIDLSNVEKISDSAFLGCKNLRKVVISDKAKVVSRDAFDDCSKNLRIIYKDLSMSKESFFKIFEGDICPSMTIDEIHKSFIASE